MRKRNYCEKGWGLGDFIRLYVHSFQYTNYRAILLWYFPNLLHYKWIWLDSSLGQTFNKMGTFLPKLPLKWVWVLLLPATDPRSNQIATNRHMCYTGGTYLQWNSQSSAWSQFFDLFLNRFIRNIHENLSNHSSSCTNLESVKINE